MAEAAVEEILPDFSGKVVVLYLSNDTDPQQSGSTMLDGKFQRQGEKLFLCGMIPEGVTDSDWAAGVQMAVAWDRVVEYLVFESMDDYFDRVQRVHRENFH